MAPARTRGHYLKIHAMTNDQVLYLAFTILGGILWIVTYGMIRAERRADWEMKHEIEEDDDEISSDNSDKGKID